MGLFNLPKCPHCGEETVATGYSYPYPQLRCNRCCNKNAKKQIKRLEKKNKRVRSKASRGIINENTV